MRGRAWIGLVGFALIGIVAMQLALLKLNTSIGHDLRAEAQLQRENAGLQADVSSLSAVDRVQARATQLGMVLAAPGSVRFLAARADPGARRAALALDVHAAGSPGASVSTATGAVPTGTATSPTAAPVPASSVALPSAARGASPPAAVAPASSAPGSPPAPASGTAGAPSRPVATSPPPAMVSPSSVPSAAAIAAGGAATPASGG